MQPFQRQGELIGTCMYVSDGFGLLQHRQSLNFEFPGRPRLFLEKNIPEATRVRANTGKILSVQDVGQQTILTGLLQMKKNEL